VLVGFNLQVLVGFRKTDRGFGEAGHIFSGISYGKHAEAANVNLTLGKKKYLEK